MTITITDIEVRDIRFPTSDHLDGSDAMNRSGLFLRVYHFVHG